jgi:hypothetical protein
MWEVLELISQFATVAVDNEGAVYAIQTRLYAFLLSCGDPMPQMIWQVAVCMPKCAFKGRIISHLVNGLGSEGQN